MSERPMQPERVRYVETYRVSCPHGCQAGAEVTLTRERGGVVIAIDMRCQQTREDGRGST